MWTKLYSQRWEIKKNTEFPVSNYLDLELLSRWSPLQVLAPDHQATHVINKTLDGFLCRVPGAH